MGTYRLGVFPSINNKYSQDDIAHEVVKFIVNKFPVQFFTHIYVDTETGNANEYMTNEQGDLIKYESGNKIQQPNLRVTVKQNGNTIDEAFNGIWNINKAPGAHGIDPDLTGYEPSLYDPYGIILARNEYPIRNTIEFKITVQTKADQLAVLNMLDTNVKHHYGEIIISESKLIIPQLVLEYLRSCIFRPEINMLARMDETEDVKEHYQKDINKMFIEHLFKFSNGQIIPYRFKNGEEYTGTIFALKRRQRVYLRLEKPEPDDGEKKGSAYDSFNINISGYFDYANCVSFVSSVPAIIRGTKNNWYLKTSGNKDKLNYYRSMKFKEVYKEERNNISINSNYSHFYHERELLMSCVNESFDFLDDILDKKQFYTHYKLVETLLPRIKTQAEFDKLFKIVIYKKNNAISDFTVDKNFHFNVKNCDLKVPYYIDIFINKVQYSLYYEQIRLELKNNFGMDWNEPNTNLYHGSRWDIILPSQLGKAEQYVPIKSKLFLKPDTSYNYYVKVDDTFFINNTEVETNGFDESITYYVKDEAENYIAILTDSFLIPDAKYIYYIDNKDGTYSQVKNITEFDKTKEYAIMIQESDHCGISGFCQET